MGHTVTVVLLFGSLGLGVGQAGAVLPCTAGAAGENIIPVGNGQTTYCVSDFGWSDSWFLGSPATHNPALDMFSGDDAFNLKYTTATGGGAGLGWLSPSLDKDTLFAQPVVSRYSVVTTVHYTGANSAESVIANPDGLQITIDTTASGPGVLLGLTIKNTSSSTISGLQLADYFNFHPNGSVFPNYQAGTTYYSNGCIFTTVAPALPVLSNGKMCGSAVPNNFDVGAIVWLDVQNGTYNNFAGSVGPGDHSGALEWNLGNLGSGASISFFVNKNDATAVSAAGGSAPEPASLALMFLGSAALYAAARLGLAAHK